MLQPRGLEGGTLGPCLAQGSQLMRGAGGEGTGTWTKLLLPTAVIYSRSAKSHFGGAGVYFQPPKGPGDCRLEGTPTPHISPKP